MNHSHNLNISVILAVKNEVLLKFAHRNFSNVKKRSVFKSPNFSHIGHIEKAFAGFFK